MEEIKIAMKKEAKRQAGVIVNGTIDAFCVDADTNEMLKDFALGTALGAIVTFIIMF